MRFWHWLVLINCVSFHGILYNTSYSDICQQLLYNIQHLNYYLKQFIISFQSIPHMKGELNSNISNSMRDANIFVFTLPFLMFYMLLNCTLCKAGQNIGNDIQRDNSQHQIIDLDTMETRIGCKSVHCGIQAALFNNKQKQIVIYMSNKYYIIVKYASLKINNKTADALSIEVNDLQQWMRYKKIYVQGEDEQFDRKQIHRKLDIKDVFTYLQYIDQGKKNKYKTQIQANNTILTSNLSKPQTVITLGPPQFSIQGQFTIKLVCPAGTSHRLEPVQSIMKLPAIARLDEMRVFMYKVKMEISQMGTNSNKIQQSQQKQIDIKVSKLQANNKQLQQKYNKIQDKMNKILLQIQKQKQIHKLKLQQQFSKKLELHKKQNNLIKQSLQTKIKLMQTNITSYVDTKINQQAKKCIGNKQQKQKQFSVLRSQIINQVMQQVKQANKIWLNGVRFQRYHFSSIAKNSGISIINETTAISTNNHTYKIALISPMISDSIYSQIKIKIHTAKVGCWLAVGLSTIDPALSQSYQQNPGIDTGTEQSAKNKGLYLLSNTGFTYSSFKANENFQKRGFIYGEGDEITLQLLTLQQNDLNKKIIRYTKGDSIAEIEIKASQDAQQKLSFCVMMSKNLTKVEVIGSRLAV